MLLTEKEAADLLRLRPKTLTRWRWERRGPISCKIGGAVRYRLEDVEAFIAEMAVQHG